MKAMSLSLETIVLLILMAIVLAALLMFFLGVFNPAKGKIDVMRDKENACLQYVSADPSCAHITKITEGTDPYKGGKYDQAKTAITKITNEICNKPANDPVCTASSNNAADCIKACCPAYCR